MFSLRFFVCYGVHNANAQMHHGKQPLHLICVRFLMVSVPMDTQTHTHKCTTAKQPLHLAKQPLHLCFRDTTQMHKCTVANNKHMHHSETTMAMCYGANARMRMSSHVAPAEPHTHKCTIAKQPWLYANAQMHHSKPPLHLRFGSLLANVTLPW